MLQWWESPASCASRSGRENQGGGKGLLNQGDRTGALSTLTNQCIALDGDKLNECEVARSLNGDHDDRVTDSGTSVVHVGMAQNTRDEVRIVGDGEIVGALPAEPGMKQQTYVVSTNSNGEDVAPTLTLELARQTGAQQANGGVRHQQEGLTSRPSAHTAAEKSQAR